MYIIGNSAFSEYIFEECLLQSQYVYGILNLEDHSYIDRHGNSKPALINSSSKFLLTHSNPSKKLEVINYLTNTYHTTNANYPSLVFNTSFVSKNAKIGIGNIITRHTEICQKVVIGDFNTINSYVHIGAESKLGNFNTIENHASIGYKVSIRNKNIVRTNSVIATLCSIEDSNTIETGECLFEDLESDMLFQSGIAQKSYGK